MPAAATPGRIPEMKDRSATNGLQGDGIVVVVHKELIASHRLIPDGVTFLQDTLLVRCTIVGASSDVPILTRLAVAAPTPSTGARKGRMKMTEVVRVPLGKPVPAPDSLIARVNLSLPIMSASVFLADAVGADAAEASGVFLRLAHRSVVVPIYDLSRTRRKCRY